MVARIGLSGGIGCGKSTVCKLFESLGIHTISADEIARKLTQPETAEWHKIISHFGDKIRNQDGSLNRRALRAIVFNDAQQKQALEAILHPPIRQQMLALSAAIIAPYCILEIPLLIETEQYKSMHRVVVITAQREIRIQRLMQGRGMARQTIEIMMKNQIKDAKRNRYADDIIENNHSIAQLESRVKELHHGWLSTLSLC